MDLTWSLDYCLACDRQTSGGAYCSQSCRLADLETSTWSGPSSPTNVASTETQRGSGFYLSPAINFANYKTGTNASTSTSTASNPQSSAHSTHFSTNYTQQSSTKSLSPSSSRSSLNSNSSETSQNQLSQQIHNELRAYTNSFDTTRNWRRRTWS